VLFDYSDKKYRIKFINVSAFANSNISHAIVKFKYRLYNRYVAIDISNELGGG